jgi:hypothetical protein
MEAQHLSALSLQSLFYIAETKMHEIDLECLATLPHTLRALQAQLHSLQGVGSGSGSGSGAAPASGLVGAEPEYEYEAEASPTADADPAPLDARVSATAAAAPTFSRRQVRASVPLSAA